MEKKTNCCRCGKYGPVTWANYSPYCDKCIAEKTSVKEDILKKLGCKIEREIITIDVNENKTKKKLYRTIIKIEGIKGCGEPISLPVIGGKKNLLGKDILQAFNAIINEKTKKISCPYINMTHLEMEGEN